MVAMTGRDSDSHANVLLHRYAAPTTDSGTVKPEERLGE